MGNWIGKQWGGLKTWAAGLWRDKRDILLSAAEGVVLSELDEYAEELKTAIMQEGPPAIERLRKKYHDKIKAAFSKYRTGA